MDEKSLKKVGKYPNGFICRRDDNRIGISYQLEKDRACQYIACEQSDARLIAKRINQFLDAGG